MVTECSGTTSVFVDSRIYRSVNPVKSQPGDDGQMSKSQIETHGESGVSTITVYAGTELYSKMVVSTSVKVVAKT